MSTSRAVIFDFDGTLANSLADIAGALNHVLAERQLPVHSLDRYQEFIGEGVETLIRRALPEGAHGLVQEVLSAYRQRYAEHLSDQTSLYSGVPELLDALMVRKIPMAILSNKRDDFTLASVRLLLSRWRFEHVRGEREGVPRKPDPSAALEIAHGLGVPPASCAFVGDTRIDMLTAKAAGMAAIGVLWGFRGREELLAHGAQAVLAAPLELLAHLAP